MNEPAFAELEHRCRTAPQDSRHWRNLGVWFQRHGQRDRARQAYRQALDLHAGEPDVWIQLAATYLADNAPWQALELLQRGQLACPRSPALLAPTARVLEHLGHHEGAVELMRQAQQSSPDSALLVQALAQTLANAGHHQEALDTLEAHPQAFGATADHRLLRGRCLYWLGRSEPLRQWLRETAHWPEGELSATQSTEAFRAWHRSFFAKAYRFDAVTPEHAGVIAQLQHDLPDWSHYHPSGQRHPDPQALGAELRRRFVSRVLPPRELAFVVTRTRPPCTPVGWVQLVDIDTDFASAEILMVISPQHRGAGAPVLLALCHRAFSAYGLEKLNFYVAEHHTEGAELATRFGLAREGFLAGQIRDAQGKRRGLYLFGLTREAFHQSPSMQRWLDRWCMPGTEESS